MPMRVADILGIAPRRHWLAPTPSGRCCRSASAARREKVDQVWVLRMMAEELRHGYQMLHPLLDENWNSEQSAPDIVEEILSMQIGSHVLGAFNIDFDSLVDNITVRALIDRVGKYQLSMQRISAYKPMAESMPKMLREEAFHLATERGADAPLGHRGGRRQRLRHNEDARRHSTSGCREISRCSATSAAAAPMCGWVSSR